MIPMRRAATWSIPAHAGEPLGMAKVTTVREVYPRPRGGTQKSRIERRDESGLSPPTRGNPGDLRQPSPYLRSIPAHAGEPDAKPPRTLAD